MNSRFWDYLTRNEKIFIFIALFFFFSGIALIVLLFSTRLLKNNRKKRRRILKDYFQQSFNSLIIQETTTTVPAASYQFTIDSIAKSIKNSLMAKQVLVDQLIVVKKSLSGSSSRVLEKLFLDMDLHLFCMNKLNSFSWKIKAQGIRELTELNYVAAIDRIQIFLRASNKTLREEAFIAQVRLQKDNPLEFLNEYKGKITPWMRINIHIHLSKLDTRLLPDFSQWFSSGNPDIISFAISMARQFRQSSCVYPITTLLSHNDSRIISLAVETIGEFEAYESADMVAILSPRFFGDVEISARIVRCLGRIGHTNEHKEIINKYLDHSDYTVRFNAVQALLSIDPDAILDMDVKRRQRLSGIINHISEPLLQ